MRIEEFLTRHGLKVNPFANAEEAQGDEVLIKLIQSSGCQFGHPQWPKFYGDPPGNQTSVVFGLKGSGKTAMRLSLNAAIEAHNSENPENQVLLVHYTEFNGYLDRWKTDVEKKLKKEKTFWDRVFGRPQKKASLLHDWTLAHHIDAILAETTLHFEGMLANSPTNPKQWDEHQKYNLFLLAAIYLPLRSSDYHRTLDNLHSSMFVKKSKFKERLKNISTLGISTYNHRRHAHIFALRIGRMVQVLNHDLQDLREALCRIPLKYLRNQPLMDAGLDVNHEPSRYDMLQKLSDLAKAAGYARVVVAIDKVDEPTIMNGDYDEMFYFIRPLWSNKLLQTSGIQFKMLLPTQLHRNIRKADGNLLNTARLDKANMIHPFTWSGNHLYEMLCERAGACLTNEGEEFDIYSFFEPDVPRSELLEALETTKIPRYASKFMNKLLSEMCEHILKQELGENKPQISHRIFDKICVEMETEMRNETQDLLEY